MIRRSRVPMRFLGALCCASLGLFLAISLFSYHQLDPSPWCTVARIDGITVANWGGWIGAWLAAVLFVWFGVGAFLLIPLLGSISWQLLRSDASARSWGRALGWVLLFSGVISLLASLQWRLVFEGRAGGELGRLLARFMVRCTDPFIGSWIPYILISTGIILLIRFAWAASIARVIRKIWRPVGRIIWRTMSIVFFIFGPFLAISKRICRWFYETFFAPQTGAIEPALADNDDPFTDPFWHETIEEAHSGDYPPEPDLDDEKQDHASVTDVFTNTPQNTRSAQVESVIKERGRILESVLHRYGALGKVVSWTTGPVITCFEYSLAPGTKVAQLLALADDISVAMGVSGIRILAPIPGKTLVGFEIPNPERDTVFFSDLVHRLGFVQGDIAIPLIIGVNTVGHEVIADLTQLPHLLIAGSTGSGKSVALHTLLASILCSKSPDEVRLLLVDPKRLEFASYQDMPHLLLPVIQEVSRVPLVLKWLVHEMERRYQVLATAGVRNVGEYRRLADAQPMPYLVLVIDELADLMMLMGNEIETLLARLAQMARAAGIHLIVATQRPSVDVLTGVIKVNFPARIACKVASKIDSRTIIDNGGAELLLGRGDMLFLSNRGIERCHGSYIRDEEVKAIVSYWREHAPLTYVTIESAPLSVTDSANEDPLYAEVAAFVQTLDEISISLVQRRFRIGFNRSARLLELLESKGMIYLSKDGKTRKVVKGA